MAVSVEYPCSIISGKNSKNTVLSKTPTEILSRNRRVFSDTFFLSRSGIATIMDNNETIMTLMIAYIDDCSIR